MSDARPEPHPISPSDSASDESSGASPRSLVARLAWLARRVLIIYLVLLLLLRFFDNSIISPAPTADARWRESQWLECEDIQFASSDGIRLHGRYVEPPKPRGFLLYCHGNGENVSDLAEQMALLRDEYDVAVFAFDYRGYGKSEGAPDEAGVLMDGAAAHAWLSQRASLALADRESEPSIILMGRSLGGAVAVDIAANNIVQGLVIENTFSSMPDVAARLYPWAPVHWLMRNHYNSAAKISKHQGPLLQTHGSQDEMIPVELARTLFDASNSADKTFVEINNGSHNDMPSKRYYDELEALFHRVFAKPAARAQVR